MSNILNRNTLEYKHSVSECETKYPTSEWIWNVDLSGVQGVEKKYWKVVGDSVVEMSSAEKQIVDDSEDNTIIDESFDANIEYGESD